MTRRKKIDAVLLDITGVLYESGSDGGKAIEGSPQAVQKLREAGYKLKFCTNETSMTRKALVERLRKNGFSLSEEEIHSPAAACRAYLTKNNLRPYFILHADALPDYEGIDTNDPNCVVLGDATDAFSYESLNEGFRLLIDNNKDQKRTLLSLGKGRYYKENGELCLDVGPFMKALEYATGLSAMIIGKPSPSFFMSALQDLKVAPENAIMVGDDLDNDVGGSQRCGLAGILVRTGKYRPREECDSDVKPHRTLENLAEAVEYILKYNQ